MNCYCYICSSRALELEPIQFLNSQTSQPLFMQISELKGADGLYVDEGTQTYSFRTAPFKQKTTLAEVMVDRPLKLHLQLQSERVSTRHPRASCVFTFLCGHTFHRKEFATHFRYPMTSSLLSQVIGLEYINTVHVAFFYLPPHLHNNWL